MLENYQVDTSLSIPIYQQLVDKIRTEVKTGHLPAGTQLPTVRDLAEQLSIAPGTIKRAYDELELEKIVEKMQGRGTFVSYQPLDSDSRKERAMTLIDQLMDQLEEMHFSVSEMNIFLNLKLREREDRQTDMKVALVECNPETMFQLSDQLRKEAGVDLYSYLLEDILAYPYKLSEDMDLIVVSAEHAAQLDGLVSEPEKIAKIALRLTGHTVAQLVKLKEHERIGVLSYSERFGQVVAGACANFTENVAIAEPLLLQNLEEVQGYLTDKTAILVPEGYEKFAEKAIAECIQLFERNHLVIRCCYKVDDGSYMYLEEKLERARQRARL